MLASNDHRVELSIITADPTGLREYPGYISCRMCEAPARKVGQDDIECPKCGTRQNRSEAAWKIARCQYGLDSCDLKFVRVDSQDGGLLDRIRS